MARRRVDGGFIDVDTLRSLADKIEADGQKAARAILGTRVGQVTSAAVRQVPVRTGRLKAGVVNLDRSSGNVVRRVLGIMGPAGAYARFVKSNKYGQNTKGEYRHVLTVHFRKPTDTLRKELPKAVIAALAKEVDDG